MARRTATEATAGNAAHAGEVVPNARAAAVFLHVDELRPNPRNPRMHGPEVLKLARTILRTAWGAPIVAQARSRRIIGGHGRLEAAKEILAGIEVDGELRGGAEHYFDSDAPAPGMVPVRLVDVSDAEADAMMLADNAHALQGRDDGALIVEMAAGFGRESAMMADMGFDGAALDALVRQAGDAVIGASMGDPASAFGALPDGDKSPFQHVGFTLSDAQAETVTAAIEKAMVFVDDGNPAERRAAALTCVCEAFVG